jgi:hypothetical protein
MTRGGRFEAVATPSVRACDLEALFTRVGCAWEDACHVTATTSLFTALRERRSPAIPIASLIDLLVLARRSADRPLELDGYPAASGAAVDQDAQRKALRRWSGLVSGLRLRQSVRFDELLRRHHEANGGDAARLSVLMHGRRDFQRVLESLVAAGFRPRDEDVAPRTALGRAALGAWRSVEERMPEFSWVRDDLWSRDDGRRAEMLVHLRSVLGHVFGARDRWTISYHGFYFFTPPQWALFQLLREADFVDQLFIVHDDGYSPAFESWRRFFTEALDMPVPRTEEQVAVPTTPGGSALRAALSGRPVDGAAADASLRVLRCGTSTDLVHEIQRIRCDANQGRTPDGGVADEPPPAPRIYAARHGEIARLCDRLAPDASESSGPSLAQLPIGAFLLRLHECIRPGDAAGSWSLVLTADAVRDMAESGFLLPASDRAQEVACRRALRQALPFFRGCRLASEWIERARQLERMVIDHVGRFGPKGECDDTVARVRGVVGNTLRLVPWGDLSVGQARSVRAVLEAIAEVLEQIVTDDRIDLASYGEFLRRRLEGGLGSVPEEERLVVEAKLDGLAMRGLAPADERIHVVGLLDIVQILLGREAKFDEVDDGDGPLPGPSDALRVRPLRGLDALGFEASAADIHIANLADGAFPAVVPAVGWPLSREDLVGEGPLAISRQILERRSEFAAMSDLYLLSLALDGVEEGRRTTLSWIADMAGEPRSLSGMVSLVVCPDRRRLARVADKVGGVRIVDASLDAGVAMELSAPGTCAPVGSSDDAAKSCGLLPREAVASAEACPRRFALQWLLGPTPAFQPDFLQAMLFGNAVGALVKTQGVGEQDALAIGSDFWRHLTVGERSSSFANRVIKPNGGPDPAWRFTLAGSGFRSTSLSRAFQAAAGIASASAATASACGPAQVLPSLDQRAIKSHSENCKYCPVQSRCQRRVDRDEGA